MYTKWTPKYHTKLTKVRGFWVGTGTEDMTGKSSLTSHNPPKPLVKYWQPLVKYTRTQNKTPFKINVHTCITVNVLQIFNYFHN